MSWENAVIGTALASPSAMQEAEELVPSDFTGPNQIVWAEMLALHNQGGVDPRALIEALRRASDWPGYASDAGNPEDYIANLISYRGDAMSTYVNKVLGESIKRSLKRSAALIAAEVNSGEEKDANELLDYAEKQILSLRRNRMNNGITMADLIGVFIPRLEGMRAGTIKPAWVPKCQAVKNIIDFAEGSDFIIIAARPGEGKSSFVRYEAFHRALSGGHPIIFNLENDPIEYARYMIALDTGIDSRKLRAPNELTPDQLVQIKQSAEKLSRLSLRIVTMARPSVLDILRTARRKVSEQKADLIAVDYIQLVDNGKSRKVDDVAETTGTLRGLALQMGVPVLAASQLSRDIEKRGQGSDPLLSDLRDSGSIEQDATIVGFVRSIWTDPTPQQMMIFPENVGPDGRPLPRMKAIPVRFHIEKNRNGEAGISEPVKWNKAIGSFQTLARGTRL